MKKINKILFLSLISLFLVSLFETVHAESSTGDFSIEAVLEGHQKDENISYWWLKVKKGESIKLNLIINNGNEENNFEIAANQAVNNNNFTLDYSLSDEKVEQYLAEKEPTFNFYKDIFFEKEAKAGPLKLILAPNEVREIAITFKVPKAGIRGQAIGGINVTKIPKESDRQQGILNVYSNVVALLMEDINYSNKKEKNLEFDLGKSNETEQIIEVKNPNSSLLRQVSLEARITDNNGKIVSEFQSSQTAVVPNASVSLKLNNQHKLIKGEEYKLTIKDSKQKLERVLHVSKSGEINIVENKSKQMASTSKKPMKISMVILAFIVSGEIVFYFKK